METGTEQPKAEKQPETVTLTKAEHAALVRERDEARESEKFWAGKARGSQPEPEPEEEAIDTDELVPEVTGNKDLDEAIFEDPEKWTDAISKGPKAIGQYIKKLGLVTGAEAAEIAVKAAQQVVGRTVRGMQSDNQLFSDFPDMKNTESELFNTAKPIFQKLVKMNGGKMDTTLIYAAAEAAKAKLDAKPKPKQEDDDPYDRYDEDDRRARADAQGARRGRSAPIDDDTQSELGPEALAICKAMNITPEDFSKSQKELGGRRRK